MVLSCGPPIYASGGVLELVLLLAEHWERDCLQGTYDWVWFGGNCDGIIGRRPLEWRNTALGNSLESAGRVTPPVRLEGSAIVHVCGKVGTKIGSHLQSDVHLVQW